VAARVNPDDGETSDEGRSEGPGHDGMARVTGGGSGGSHSDCV